MDRPSFLSIPWIVISACLLWTLGCASWSPTGEEPASPKKSNSLTAPPSTLDTAGIETILVRLDSNQSQQVEEVWSQIDEQAIKPELRIALDRNGMRAGKISSTIPLLLEQWIQQTVRRVEENPMEQAGLAADISSYAQLWRCRDHSRKELTIRRLSSIPVNVAYHDGSSFQENLCDSPHFLMSIHAAPLSDTTAKIRMVPEVEYGEFVKKVVTREAAIRTDTRRESLVFEKLAVDLRIQKGEYLLFGPTAESRSLGEHYFHTLTQTGEVQPVLLVVRLSESNKDDAFSMPQHSKPR